MSRQIAEEPAIAHRPQFPAERLQRDGDAELFENPLAEIDEAPAHHTMDRRGRTLVDHPDECRSMRVAEPRGLA